MNIQFLEQAGLTATEAKIYIMLLESGSSLAGTISRNTGIHRRSVYDAIERLIEKGLVSYIKTNNRKYFEAAEPDRLLEIMKEKEANIKTLIPELELKKKLSKDKKETLFYRGRLAMKTLFDDQIRVGKEILIFGAAVDAPEILKYYFPHFDKSRAKRKIPVKIIFDESARGNEYVRKIPLAQVRFVPKEYASPAATNIYGDNLAIVLWSENPMGVLIREKGIADGYRKYFQLIWKMAKP